MCVGCVCVRVSVCVGGSCVCVVGLCECVWAVCVWGCVRVSVCGLCVREGEYM